MKVRELLNKWKGERLGKTVTIFCINKNLPLGQQKQMIAASKPFETKMLSKRKWEFDLDSDATKEMLDMTVDSFYFNDDGLKIVGIKK